MKKTSKVSLVLKLINYVVIPIVLIVFWIGISLFSDHTVSFLTVTFNHTRNDFISVKNTRLLAGQKVVGKFTAQENNLGIIAVRFNTYRKINEDILTFRLKEANAKNWYYTARYTVGQFQPDKLFTFGFPIIPDAKGKQYIFEITSIKGTKNDSVSVSYDEPVYISTYKFTKTELTTNKRELVIFLFEKIKNTFMRLDFAVAALTYLLPLIMLYVLWLRIPKRFLKKNFNIVYLFFVFNVINIFMLDSQTVLIMVSLLGLWVLLIKIYRLHYTVSFTFSLVYLVIVPLLVLLSFEDIAEGFALWSYIFLLVGVVQALVSIKFLRGFTITSGQFFGIIITNIRTRLKL